MRGAWPNHRAAFDFAATQREAFDAAVARGEIDVKTGMPTKDSDSSGMHLPPRGWIPPPFPMRLAVGAKLYLKQCVMSASGLTQTTSTVILRTSGRCRLIVWDSAFPLWV